MTSETKFLIGAAVVGWLVLGRKTQDPHAMGLVAPTAAELELMHQNLVNTTFPISITALGLTRINADRAGKGLELLATDVGWRLNEDGSIEPAPMIVPT